jgi:glutamate/tyrosine decarboxylase-like PLP-dependent enzyme
VIPDPDLVARLVARVGDHLLAPVRSSDPVLRYGAPDSIRASFADSVPLDFLDTEPAHDADELLAATEAVMAWSVATNHPRFVNQNFAGPDPVGVIGDWLGAALNTTGATYEVAPVFTLMEHAVLDKLARLAGFPRAATPDDVPPGMFCPGGSVGLLFALQLARHRHDPAVTTRGATGGRYAVFVSTSGHYSTRKAAALLGLGTDAVISVPTDPTGAMDPGALAAAIEAAPADGRTPLAVVATAGTTVTGAFDPLDDIAAVTGARDLWLHVDGAYGGSALFSPRQRSRLRGIAQADSMVWDLHKMMGMTQQCSVLLVRDPTRLDQCFAENADYLFQPDKRNASLDAGDRTFQCGRRTDVAKLWLSWKAHGDSGFAARVDHAVALADHVRARVDDGDGTFAFASRGDFTNTCLLWIPPGSRATDTASLPRDLRDRLHALAPAVKARMQDEGTAMIGYQPLDGLNCFRLLFMNPRVTADDADTLLGLIDRYASEVWAS